MQDGDVITDVEYFGRSADGMRLYSGTAPNGQRVHGGFHESELRSQVLEPAPLYPARTTPIVSHLERYIGGDTTSEIFAKLVGGDSRAHTVFNALETAERRYLDIADEMYAGATALMCDGDQSYGPLAVIESMIRQFEQQAADVRTLLAYLRGDDEPASD